MIAQWAYAEVVAPNAPGLFGNRWIFWVKLPSLIKANAEKVWETIEDLIRKENPTIGDMTGFPRYPSGGGTDRQIARPRLKRRARSVGNVPAQAKLKT